MDEKINKAEASHHIDYKTTGSRWMVLLALSFAYSNLGEPDSAKRLFEEACDETSLDTFPMKDRVEFGEKIGVEVKNIEHRTSNIE